MRENQELSSNYLIFYINNLICPSSLKLIQLEKEKEEKQKLAEKLEAEKEMMQRKVTNLKRSPLAERNSVSNKILPEVAQTEILDDTQNYFETDKEDEIKIDSNKIFNKRNIVEDINSDLENQSVR